MKIKVVKKTRMPQYPDQYTIEKNRELLYYQPKFWKKEPLIGLAVTALLGSGLVGCDPHGKLINTGEVMGDMVFLPVISQISDNDALEIIAEELGKAGYGFEKEGENYGFEFDGKIVANNLSINLEFVSYEDYINGKYPNVSPGSEEAETTREMAEELKSSYPDAAIFYAPSEHSIEDGIRLQVRDFIEWLQTVTVD